MTPRDEADALARELVASGWGPPFGVHLHPRDLGGGLQGPNLLSPVASAVLAVQAMEAGAAIEPHLGGDWSARFLIGNDAHGYYGPLGIVAARALIAIKGGE